MTLQLLQSRRRPERQSWPGGRGDVGNDEYKGIRTSILFEPNEQISFSLSYLNQSLDQDGFPEVQLNLDAFQQSRLGLGNIIGGDELLKDDIEIINMVFEYDFGWASLLSSSSWIEEEHSKFWGIGSFVGGLPVSNKFENKSDVFVEEIRLSSKLDGDLQYLVGLYYEDIDASFDERNYWGADQLFNPFDPSTALLSLAQDSSPIEQVAIFGELSYSITEHLEFTLGARQFDYEKTEEQVRDGFFFGGPSSNTRDNEDNGTTYRFNATYRPNEEVLLYTQYAEGFRLGKSTVPLSAVVCDLDNDGLIDGTNISITKDSTDPDNLDSYEIGGKFTLLNGRVNLNIAAYRNEWDGIPIAVQGTCGQSVVANAGEARTQGFEVESIMQLASHLRIDIGASIVSAELTTDAPGVGGFAGDRLPGSPGKNANLGFQYDFSLTKYPMYIRADYAYVGGFL